MTKALKPTENSKKQTNNSKTTPKTDYATITDRLRMVSWSNNSHPTGVVKRSYGIPTFLLTAQAV